MPLRDRRTNEEIAARLRALIEGRRPMPGDLRSERELSQRLGVSRTSVRQALAALRPIALVDVRPGDGAYPMRPPDEVVRTLAVEMFHVEADHPMVWEAREGLEVHAARLAASRSLGDRANPRPYEVDLGGLLSNRHRKLRVDHVEPRLPLSLEAVA